MKNWSSLQGIEENIRIELSFVFPDWYLVHIDYCPINDRFFFWTEMEGRKSLIVLGGRDLCDIRYGRALLKDLVEEQLKYDYLAYPINGIEKTPISCEGISEDGRKCPPRE